MPENGSAPPPTPSALALRDILKWSRGRRAWQRDALRRLWQQGELTTEDLDELELMCRAKHRALEAGEEGQTPRPLGEPDIPSAAAGRSVSLRSIKNVQHVNALASGQTLKFRHDSLTIVYGRNASGKSGYVRVLKKACRARASDERILPDVYGDSPPEAASATIEYEIGDMRPTAAWRDGNETDKALSAVSVFDAACASIHVEKTNDVAYTPAALDVLRKLAEACRKLKQRLQRKADSLRAEKPVSLREPPCRDYTRVGRLVKTLSAQTKVKDVEELADLKERERKRMEQLKADLAKDPAKAAQQLGPQKARLGETVALVRQTEGRLSDAALKSYGKLLSEAKGRAEAARLAATELFKDEPLPRIGSEAWRNLWESARAYSGQEAYPEEVFPFTSDKARCVLCQQLLTSEAADRLQRFEEFVKENTQRKAEEAKRAVVGRREEVESVSLSPARCRKMVSQLRDELDEPVAATSLLRHLRDARWRRRLALRWTEKAAALPESPPSPQEELAASQKRLERRIAELQAAARSADRKAQERELHELEDRAWLSRVIDDVRTEIARLVKLV